eukprot:scaffold14477_cov130-Isochrysis_galbana.AAC.6
MGEEWERGGGVSGRQGTEVISSSSSDKDKDIGIGIGIGIGRERQRDGGARGSERKAGVGQKDLTISQQGRGPKRGDRRIARRGESLELETQDALSRARARGGHKDSACGEVLRS